MGTVDKVSDQESRDYFHSRPRESQLAAYASYQSSAVASRDEWAERFAKLDQQYAEQPIPTPDFWGGYRVTPQLIEFWQAGRTGCTTALYIPVLMAIGLLSDWRPDLK